MSDKFYVGLDITSCKNNGKRMPITSVTLQIDAENTVTAGTYTGLDLYAVCPYATQEMALAILVQVQGYQYQAFSADAASLDPAAELGDGVDVDGLYSVISAIQDDGSGYPGISAPGEEELEDEYPYRSETSRDLTGDIESLRAFITKSLGTMQSSLNLMKSDLQEICLKVDDMSEKISQLEFRVSVLEGKAT